jgi:nucleoside-diphosphate-sugar epimerase
MNVLVTGATGCLGAVAAEALDCEAARTMREALAHHAGALILGRRRNVA